MVQTPASPREAYAPPIPSPLNPTSLHDTPRRARRKGHGPLSPTQKLMRRKAAAAWRSMELLKDPCSPQAHNRGCHGHERSQMTHLPPLTEENPSCEYEEEEEEEEEDDDDVECIEEDEEPLVAMEEYHDGDFVVGVLGADVEKQPLVLEIEYGSEDWRIDDDIVAQAEAGQTPFYPYEKASAERHRPGTRATRQAMTAAGFICLIGIWAVLRSLGGFREP
ncbi:hypothetical protein F5Y15DRAFT_15415 [Xylariaceae sp. FL0016]|nr:hypothetical protein F5Y15DRAFT_15415 [Xylariaceae sp. FL0016]